MNNCHYNQVADIHVFNTMNGDECIHPVFERKTIKYIQRQERSLDEMGLAMINNSYVMLPPKLNIAPLLGGQHEINHRWCELSLLP